MSICIEKETDRELFDGYEKVIEDVISAALDYVGCPYEAAVDVRLVNPDAIRGLNLQFRQIDSATDVLSFPMIAFETPADFSQCEDSGQVVEFFNVESGELMLGDIVLCVDKIYEQAARYGHSPVRELAFLTAHSMLHLFGYDHIDDAERLVMEQKQEEILALAGYTRDYKEKDKTNEV